MPLKTSLFSRVAGRLRWMVGGVQPIVYGGSSKWHTWPAVTSLTGGTDTTPVSGTRFTCEIFVPYNMIMTGIGYLIGAGSKADVEGEVEGRSRPFAGVSVNGLRTIGAVLLIVPCGILVSSALAYHETWLAPKAQLAELSEIGQKFEGEGPALMTEYQAYGVRHFLRRLDAEGASELRRRVIPRLDGSETAKGEWSDTDQLVMDPGQQGVLTYRTLVLRRNPMQSLPPSPYKLVWRGDYYDVWQRDPDYDAANLIVHKPFGSGFQPAAVPNCAIVQDVASQAGSGQVSCRSAPLVTQPSRASCRMTSARGSKRSKATARPWSWSARASGLWV